MMRIFLLLTLGLSFPASLHGQFVEVDGEFQIAEPDFADLREVADYVSKTIGKLYIPALRVEYGEGKEIEDSIDSIQLNAAKTRVALQNDTINAAGIFRITTALLEMRHDLEQLDRALEKIEIVDQHQEEHIKDSLVSISEVVLAVQDHQIRMTHHGELIMIELASMLSECAAERQKKQ